MGEVPTLKWGEGGSSPSVLMGVPLPNPDVCMPIIRAMIVRKD